ncbi:hypothetical protein MSG28_000058 [Choristoneura fumiferana]|uniref:Uncharacterized protein n=1 Tax=Choristoneura fumiferana TaxID=7141 RepID=A0ACC0JZJ1_CHOFU|nr:hypothetical protein MSG28_000058 [Choristoneura fumiferana]
MAAIVVLCFFVALGAALNEDEQMFQDNRRLSKAIVEALQDSNFDSELTFDLKKENQVYLNRTMSLLIKYIVKREVDNYRSRRTDAISRRIYSSLIMKLIDIAKDLPRNTSAESRIDTAHRYYMSVESRDMHDKMADNQVFHACARLYDIVFTAPRILSQLGKFDDLTPRLLARKLRELQLKPVHLGVALLLQVISTLKALAARLLPVAELLDIHLAHSSPAFKDVTPSSWLGIVNNKQI